MEKILLTRKELYALVWSNSMLSLSKKYSISDVGLRKKCKKMDIPIPKAGYWAKVQHSKRVVPVKLPVNNKVEQSTTLFLRKEGDTTQTSDISLLTQLTKEIESTPGLPLKVPDTLRNPDILIKNARIGFNENKSYHRYNYEGCIWCGFDNLNIKVTPKSVKRALCFMDAFIKLLRKRGHNVMVKYDTTYAVVEGIKFRIYIREKMKRVKSDKYSWSSSDLIPTGLLAFKMDDYHGREWNDGKVLIEEKLANILAKLEIEAKREIQEQIESEIKRKIQEEKERKAKLLQENIDNEIENFKGLFKQANRWQEARFLRAYLTALETNASKKGLLNSELQKWFHWANKKVDWYDPLVNSPDEFLTDKHKDLITQKVEKPVNKALNWWNPNIF